MLKYTKKTLVVVVIMMMTMMTGILTLNQTKDRKMHLLYVTIFKDRPTGLWNVMLCRTYKDAETLTKTKVQRVPLKDVEPVTTYRSMTSGRIEILDYNALKTSEIQNSLFIIYNMTIKKFTL
jgi:hypothetical protein